MRRDLFRTENEFLRWLREQTGHLGRGVRLGIGDDAALVEVAHGRELILTTDLSLEGIHFLRALHPPRSVGHRALARSLSDVAAMGGTPRWALISLALSPGMTRAWIEEFFTGALKLASRFGVSLIGGDTAMASRGAAVDVIVAGEAPRHRALRRSGARPGDRIFVTGRLGLSALGLRLLRAGARDPAERAGRSSPPLALNSRTATEALQAHLYPEPRCALGRFLSEKRLATAMIDLSDGLSSDLTRLAEASGVGARVWANLIPGPQVSFAGKSRALRPLDLTLHAGEDYELLFTVPPRKVPQVPRHFRGVPLHPIGEMRDARKILLVHPDGSGSRLEPRGYDHFRSPLLDLRNG